MPEPQEQPQPTSEQQLIVTIQRVWEQADLLERTSKASRKLLGIAENFSLASRKTLASVSGASLALIVVTALPMGGPTGMITKWALAPLAGVFGGSAAALVTPSSLEERRRRERRELIAEILELQSQPRLQEPLIKRHEALVLADATELKRLFTASAQPMTQRNLPPARETVNIEKERVVRERLDPEAEQ